MAVWEPCPLNKSTNKNANSHISSEATKPESLPHTLSALLSIHKAPHFQSLALSLTCRNAHSCSYFYSLFFLCCWQEDRLTYLSCSVFVYELSSLRRLYSHSGSLFRAQICTYISSWCQSKIYHVKSFELLICAASSLFENMTYQGPTVTCGGVQMHPDWKFCQGVCLLTTHMHINKYIPKITLTWESCVCRATQCKSMQL